MASTAVYLFFLALTLFLAFYPREITFRLFWLVLSIICQFLALTWYTLSFIPFARDIVKKFCADYCCRSCSVTQVRFPDISLLLFLILDYIDISRLFVMLVSIITACYYYYYYYFHYIITTKLTQLLPSLLLLLPPPPYYYCNCYLFSCLLYFDSGRGFLDLTTTREQQK